MMEAFAERQTYRAARQRINTAVRSSHPDRRAVGIHYLFHVAGEHVRDYFARRLAHFLIPLTSSISGIIKESGAAMQSSFSSEKCDFRLDSRFADTAFSMHSDKCDFRFAVTIGNRAITITGDRAGRFGLEARVGGLHIGAGSDKCDWKIASWDDRVQSSVYSSTKGWAVKGQTKQMTAEVGQSRRAGSAKCDFVNLKTRNLNVVIASEKCDNRGLIERDWILRSGARNRIVDVASAKCDWSISSIPREDVKR